MNVSENFINVNMQFIIGENGEFKDFSEIYGRETTDKDRLSSVLKEAATSEQDKLNKPYLNAGMLAWMPVISILLFNQ